MVRAIDEGIEFVGGKKDGELVQFQPYISPDETFYGVRCETDEWVYWVDISVLVGVIGDRDQGERIGGLALHTE